MHRLFVAIDFPSAVCDRLAALCSGVPGARWVARDQLHLTVRFIGAVDGPLFRDIADALATLTLPEFALMIRGVGHFPPGGAPRVLWAGVEPVAELVELRRNVESLVVAQGVAPEGRRFTPHITLARLKSASAARLAPYLAAHARFACPAVAIEDFRLYSSRLRLAGAIHRVEASYPLLGDYSEAAGDG